MQWEIYTTAEVVFLPKMSGPNLNVENHQKSPENKTFYTKLAWTPKMSTLIKTKKENWDDDHSRLKQMRHKSQIKCMILHWTPDLESRVTVKNILKDILYA